MTCDIDAVWTGGAPFWGRKEKLARLELVFYGRRVEGDVVAR